jgi:hypothetical protein
MRDGGGMSEIERKKHWMAMIAESTIIFQDMKIVEYVAFLEAENKRLNEEKTARLKWRSTSGWEKAAIVAIDGLSCKFLGYRIYPKSCGYFDVYLDSVAGILPTDLVAIVNFAKSTDPQAGLILVYNIWESEFDEAKPSLIYDVASKLWKAKPTKRYHSEYTIFPEQG